MKNRKEQIMRKLILAATSVLALAGDVLAVDAPKLDQDVVKLFMYHNDCAPLSDKLLDLVKTMLRAMDERERVRAMMVVSVVVAGHKDEFCKAMEPGVKQLEK